MNSNSFEIQSENSSCQTVGIADGFNLLWFMTTEGYDDFKREHGIPESFPKNSCGLSLCDDSHINARKINSCPAIIENDVRMLMWYIHTDRYEDITSKLALPENIRDEMVQGLATIPPDELAVHVMRNLNRIGLHWVEDQETCNHLQNTLRLLPEYDTHSELYTAVFLRVNGLYMVLHRPKDLSIYGKADRPMHIIDAEFNLIGQSTGKVKPRQ